MSIRGKAVLRTASVAIGALAAAALSPASAEAVPLPDVEPVVIEADAGVYCDFDLKITIWRPEVARQRRRRPVDRPLRCHH